MIFPNEELAQLVKNCGSTLIFSGPVQPPMLGAIKASAQLHMSDEIYNHQKDLALKVVDQFERIEPGPASSEIASSFP